MWLTQQQMSELFSTTKQNISLHIGNIFREGELIKEVVVKDFFTTTIHGAIPGKTQRKRVILYNPSFAAVCTINSIKVVKYQQISAK